MIIERDISVTVSLDLLFQRLWVIMGGEEKYAESGSANCKGRKVEIPKGDLRLSSISQVLRVDPSCTLH